MTTAVGDRCGHTVARRARVTSRRYGRLRPHGRPPGTTAVGVLYRAGKEHFERDQIGRSYDDTV